jgi:hypothetical protein
VFFTLCLDFDAYVVLVVKEFSFEVCGPTQRPIILVLMYRNRVIQSNLFTLRLCNWSTYRRDTVLFIVWHPILGSYSMSQDKKWTFPLIYFLGISHRLWARRRRQEWDRIPTYDHYLHGALWSHVWPTHCCDISECAGERSFYPCLANLTHFS